MKQWFYGLETRERAGVIGGLLILLVFLFYLLVLQPVYSGYDKVKNNILEQRTTAGWMQVSAARVAQLAKSGGKQSTGGLGERSLLAVTDSTARAGGLADSLKRIEPEGSNGVRVWLEGASFDYFVKWLGLLSTSYRINPDSVSMEKHESPGLVNVRMTLQAAQQ